MLKPLITLSALLLGASFAHASSDCPITIVEPEIGPAECDSELFTLTYTVENNTFTDATLANIFLSPTDPAAEINESESSCFPVPHVLPAQETCTIAIDITPPNCEDLPVSIAFGLVVEPEGVNQDPIEIPITIEVIEPAFLTVLPGFEIPEPPLNTTSTITSRPYLVAHTANGNWEEITSAIFSGEFKSATCTGTDEEGVCIAVGTGSQLHAKNGPGFRGLIYASQNGGIDWDIQNSPSTLPNGELNSVSCTLDGELCAAAGNPGSPGNAFVMGTFNGGIDWQTVPVTGLGDTRFQDIACTNEFSEDGFCFAAIESSTSGGLALPLPFSEIPTKNLQPPAAPKSLSLVPNDLIYTATACTGSTTPACTAVGFDEFGPTTQLTMYFGGEDTPSANFSVTGLFLDTACTTATDGKIVCTAVGSDETNALPDSMLYINKNMAALPQAWVRVPAATVEGASFSATACNTNANKTVCIATGKLLGSSELNDPTLSLLFVNTDVTGSGTWELIDSPPGEFTGAACTVTAGNNIACTIAGRTDDITTLAFSSANVGTSDWDFPPIGSVPGCFNGAGASGANSNVNCSGLHK